MRITCPNCAAEYEVPAPTLSSGKKVRCARCGAEWRILREPVLPPQPGPPVPDADAAITREIRDLHRERIAAEPRRGITLRAAWIASLAVVVAAIVSVLAWRHDIIRAWPPSARILAPFAQTAYAPSKAVDGGEK